MNISDIQSKISFLTHTDTTNFSAADRLILVNNAMNRVTSLIIGADGRWEWDDSNQSDLPIATTTITSGQQDYSLTTSHLRIKRVERQDSNGVWWQLVPYDNADYDGFSITQLGAMTGVPLEYDLLGSSIFLTPTPNYTKAAALKVYFERGPAEFTSAEVSTGTKVPGFNSLYHDLIPLWVAYNYAVANGKATAQGLMIEIQRLEAALIADYGGRDKDDPSRLTMGQITFR